MAGAIPVTYKGVSYDSITDCCNKLGIPMPRVLQYRKTYGCTIEQALDAILSSRRYNGFVVNGEKYYTLKDACHAAGVSRPALMRKARTNEISLQAALDHYSMEGRAQNGISVTYRGTTYSSIAECCKQLGVTAETLSLYRGKYGFTIEQALDAVLSRRYSTQYFVNGEKYYTLKEACKVAQVSPDAVRARAKANSISIQDALNSCAEFRRGIIFDGEYYRSIKDLCIKLELPYGRVMRYKRLHGCSVEELVEHAKTLRDYNIQPITYEGTMYRTIRECCEVVGVPYPTVYKYRAKHNCTTEEAIRYVMNDSTVRGFTTMYTGRDGNLYGRYMCKDCGRTLLLTRGQVRKFKHSDEFCRAHEFTF